jgi:hypothetical protein
MGDDVEMMSVSKWQKLALSSSIWVEDREPFGASKWACWSMVLIGLMDHAW